MYFLIYGEDGYRARQALRSARQQFTEKRDASGLNIVRLKPGDGLSRAQEELFASPFLAERKLVVLEGFCQAKKDDQETLAEMMGRLPETTAAIFFEAAGDKELAKSPLFAVLKKQKYSQHHAAPSPAEANRLATAEATACGTKLESPALRRLLEATGLDSWRIHQEVRKLAAMVRGQKRDAIKAADVEEAVRGSREESIFAFIDACTDGKGTVALGSLENLLESGESELQVVALLQRHFRTITMARDLMSRGLDQKTAVSKLGVHPFAAGKAWRAAFRYDSRFLGFCLRRLAQMEEEMKTGASQPKASLELFTAELTEKACSLAK